MCVYIYIYMHMCIYIYIYIYVEREREVITNCAWQELGSERDKWGIVDRSIS